MKTLCIDHGKRGNRWGYRPVQIDRQKHLLHRLVWCEKHGVSIDSIRGKVVRHSCDNPRCINPDHLLLGTQTDNMNDKAQRRRCPHLKLSIQQIQEIRAKCKPSSKHDNQPNPLSYNAFARKFGVTMNAVRSAYLGINHKFVTTP